MSSFSFLQLLSIAILLAGVATDFMTRKIPNKLILFLFPFVLLASVFFQGFQGFLFQGLPAFLLAFSLGFVLAFFRIIGGGDFKLFSLLALTMSAPSVLWTLFLSLPWGLLFGFFKILLDRKLPQFFMNIYLLVRFKKPEEVSLNSIPFSLALFLGYLSWLSLSYKGAL